MTEDPVIPDFRETPCVYLYGGEKLLHGGVTDDLKISRRGGVTQITLTSRGFSSMLTQDQLEPGIIEDVTLETLVNGYYKIPGVTCEEDTRKSYIYVKKGSSVWDGIVGISYKLYGNYPYIRGDNRVMITPPGDPVSFTYDSKEMLETGSEYTTRKFISDLHMADIDGTFGNFELSSDHVKSLGIVRHSFFDLDRQFLYDPESALGYRMAYALRAGDSRFVKYSGFLGEDIGDLAFFDDETDGSAIGSVSVTFGGGGLFTKISVYPPFKSR